MTPTPSPAEGAERETMRERDEFIRRVIESVCELPDRTSPEDEPDMMLVTGEELAGIIENHWEQLEPSPPLATSRSEGEPEAVKRARATVLQIESPTVAGKYPGGAIVQSARDIITAYEAGLAARGSPGEGEPSLLLSPDEFNALHVHGPHRIMRHFDGEDRIGVWLSTSNHLITECHRGKASQPPRPAQPEGGECHCFNCTKARVANDPDPEMMFGQPVALSIFFVCQSCGNKRCPSAVDHRFPCSGSNEPGQKWSAYEQDVQGVDEDLHASGNRRPGVASGDDAGAEDLRGSSAKTFEERLAEGTDAAVALEPFAEIAKYAKGSPDACWCGQAPAVIRYQDLSEAALLKAEIDALLAQGEGGSDA